MAKATHKSTTDDHSAFIAATNDLAARSDMTAVRAAIDQGDVQAALDVLDPAPLHKPEPKGASRRGILAGIAAAVALPAAAVAGMAQEPDPVFAAIEAHKEAEKAHLNAIDTLSPLEDAWFKTRQRLWEEAHAAAREVLEKHGAVISMHCGRRGNCEGAEPPEYTAAQAEQARTCDAAFDAFDDFLETVPTTRAGLVAFVSHVASAGYGDDAQRMAAAVDTINEALAVL
jgi:hypothetical protein